MQLSLVAVLVLVNALVVSARLRHVHPRRDEYRNPLYGCPLSSDWSAEQLAKAGGQLETILAQNLGDYIWCKYKAPNGYSDSVSCEYDPVTGASFLTGDSQFGCPCPFKARLLSEGGVLNP